MLSTLAVAYDVLCRHLTLVGQHSRGPYPERLAVAPRPSNCVRFAMARATERVLLPEPLIPRMRRERWLNDG